MDRAQEPSAELLQVQGLIWVHALFGTALTLGFFWAASFHRDTVLLSGILGCAVGWLLSFAPVARSAESLAPRHRPAAKGIPPELLGVWAFGEVCSFALVEGREWILGGHLLVAGTILLRGLIALAFDVPLHRRTWIASLAILGLGTFGHLAVLIGALTWSGR
jgi:hypothetical protein